MSQLPGLVVGIVLTMLSPIVAIVTGSVIAVWLTTLCRARWFLLPGLLLAGIFWLTHDRETLLPETLAAWQHFFAAPSAWRLLPFVPLSVPLGLFFGGLAVLYKDDRLRSQEWHPLTSRRQEQQTRRLKRRMRKAAAQIQSPQALGVLFESTDLHRGIWQVRGWFRRVLIPTRLVLSRPSLIVAGPGAGKTE